MKFSTIFDAVVTLGVVATVVFIILWLIGEARNDSSGSSAGGVQGVTASVLQSIGDLAFKFWTGVVSGVDHLVGNAAGFSDREIDEAEATPLGQIKANLRAFFGMSQLPGTAAEPTEANAQYWLANPNGVPDDEATQNLLNYINANGGGQ